MTIVIKFLNLSAVGSSFYNGFRVRSTRGDQCGDTTVAKLSPVVKQHVTLRFIKKIVDIVADYSGHSLGQTAAYLTKETNNDDYIKVIAKYRRVLPTLDLIYDYLASFDKEIKDIPMITDSHFFAMRKLKEVFSTVCDQSYFSEMEYTLRNPFDYSKYQLNHDSSPGFPYSFQFSASRKRDVFEIAKKDAKGHWNNEKFDGNYLTFSRSKRRTIDKIDSIRTVEAMPFDELLTLLK